MKQSFGLVLVETKLFYKAIRSLGMLAITLPDFKNIVLNNLVEPGVDQEGGWWCSHTLGCVTHRQHRVWAHPLLSCSSGAQGMNRAAVICLLLPSAAKLSGKRDKRKGEQQHHSSFGLQSHVKAKAQARPYPDQLVSSELPANTEV